MSLLTTIVAASLLAAPPLLPDTPEGWRYERLDFPLDFAPDLGLEGYEELRFAPGMFDAQADDYFSYVLGLQIEGGVDFDEDFVQTFLEGYYSGLCESVAEGRRLEIDMSTFDVDVDRTAAGFDATIDMYDTFVTGERMVLHVELMAYDEAGNTQVFGMASPAAKDAAIWKTLHELGASWREPRSAGALPTWLVAHMDEMAGRWVADNSVYKNDLEPFDAYVLEFEYGIGRKSLVGVMHGVTSAGVERAIWEHRVAWSPVEKRAMLFQFGTDGTISIGTVEPREGGGTQSVEDYHMIDGSELRVAHTSVMTDAGLEMKSFLVGEDGSKTLVREYVWTRDER